MDNSKKDSQNIVEARSDSTTAEKAAKMSSKRLEPRDAEICPENGANPTAESLLFFKTNDATFKQGMTTARAEDKAIITGMKVIDNLKAQKEKNTLEFSDALHDIKSFVLEKQDQDPLVNGFKDTTNPFKQSSKLKKITEFFKK